MQTSTRQFARPIDLRQWIYPALLVAINFVWFSYMVLSDSWHLFREHWPVSVTMTFGSFVAGATAEGGAAVAFPVFTKALKIPAADARTFGLMIQAVGMTMAGVMIYVQRVKTLPRVIAWVSLGGLFGQVLGTFFITIPNPFPRILFTFVAATFGVALYLSRWRFDMRPQQELSAWNSRFRVIFLGIGLVGGTFAANTGSGIDMLTFIVLTLAFGINEKISTPTTVIIMGINSVVGFFLHAVISQDVGVAWNYWLVAVPIVIIGAPLGAITCARVKRDHIILFLLSLITLELVTTLWLVPMDAMSVLVVIIAVFVCVVWFRAMLQYRQRRWSSQSIQ